MGVFAGSVEGWEMDQESVEKAEDGVAGWNRGTRYPGLWVYGKVMATISNDK